MHTTPVASFATLSLHDALVKALERASITAPTPIQAQAIPEALLGKDLIGIAQTGTGKTLAFTLPILQKWLANPQEQALVLVPTRELAAQVEESIRFFSRFMQPTPLMTVIVGGAPMHRQVRDLRRNPSIILATPGRLRDHIEQKTVKLDRVSTLVLDEADRMLDMGFTPQINFICEHLPEVRQTLLFSATLEKSVSQIAERFLKDPVRVEVAPAGSSASTINQEMCYVPQPKKFELLTKILEEHKGSILLFSRTKHGASKLLTQLNHLGHAAAEIHANRSLAQRRQALAGFKSGKYRVLIATDIAARGIDVHEISLVINYDLPDATEDYVHRIGRTGRAGHQGKALSFANPDQYRDVKAIERLMKMPIPLSEYSAPEPSGGNAVRRPLSPRGNRAWSSASPQRGGGGNGGGPRRNSGGGSGRSYSGSNSGGGDRRPSGGGRPSSGRPNGGNSRRSNSTIDKIEQNKGFFLSR